ncbi:MAG TPA: hypothetical protein VFA32_07285 [Dehalococcoidia bacterium]|jgi:hypothetical protein|nr:hypothetical protein [Dehalococcoidia bacterium]
METSQGVSPLSRAAEYPLLKALIERRSRRFGRGMELSGCPLAYLSSRPPKPLTLEEEAVLAFAACGVTGYALAELPYRGGTEPESGGGNIMTHFIAVASPAVMPCTPLPCSLSMTPVPGC